MEQEREWLTVKEVAARIKADPATVRRWLIAGKMRGRKFGKTWRVLASEVRVPQD